MFQIRIMYSLHIQLFRKFECVKPADSKNEKKKKIGGQNLKHHVSIHVFILIQISVYSYRVECPLEI